MIDLKRSDCPKRVAFVHVICIYFAHIKKNFSSYCVSQNACSDVLIYIRWRELEFHASSAVIFHTSRFQARRQFLQIRLANTYIRAYNMERNNIASIEGESMNINIQEE